MYYVLYMCVCLNVVSELSWNTSCSFNLFHKKIGKTGRILRATEMQTICVFSNNGSEKEVEVPSTPRPEGNVHCLFVSPVPSQIYGSVLLPHWKKRGGLMSHFYVITFTFLHANFHVITWKELIFTSLHYFITFNVTTWYGSCYYEARIWLVYTIKLVYTLFLALDVVRCYSYWVYVYLYAYLSHGDERAHWKFHNNVIFIVITWTLSCNNIIRWKGCSFAKQKSVLNPNDPYFEIHLNWTNLVGQMCTFVSL